MILGLSVFSVLLPATVACRKQEEAGGWREALVKAAVYWGAGILVATEVLGALHAFRFWPVVGVWVIAHVIGLRLAWPKLRGIARPQFPFSAITLFGLLALTLIAALLAPPNTADVLSYHLPRQLLWIQQGSMDHFLTSDDRALMMPPLAEMIQAHAYLLSGGDHWANLPQWFAYGFGMVVVSLLAREMGAGRNAQIAAAIIFATLPMAYHQASSAKNDLLVAVWLGIATWLALRLAHGSSGGKRTWLETGIALGLALATKTTACIFLLPIGLILLRPAWRAPRKMDVAILGMVALALASPHWIRNQLWYGAPLGEHRAEDGGAQANETFGPRAVLSNAVRNTSLHLASPSVRLNQTLFNAVERVHSSIGQSVNDRKTTLWVLPYGIGWAPGDEVIAGAPAQCLLGVGVVLLWLWRGPRRGALASAMFVVASGALLFCVVLKWQAFGARLQLPLFLVMAAVSATMLERGGNRHVMTIAVIACGLAWIPSLETKDRPLFSAPTLWSTSRWENYFRNAPVERLRQEAILHTLKVAGTRSLQIVTRHGTPFPLMQRYAKENGPDAKFWGELPASLTTPPDGLLILKSDPRPLFLAPKNSTERFMALGATEPYLFYLPETKARALLTELPHPRFIGWDRATGLDWAPSPPQRIGTEADDAIMTGNAVKLSFPAVGKKMRVRFEASHESDRTQSVVVRVNDVELGVTTIAAGETARGEFYFSPAGERAELSIVAPPGITLRFSTLQILDE
jgi:4-amino-4-deoxy-L-arabinose transferase-like glycosyltransferase